jgi:hypothetical protein
MRSSGERNVRPRGIRDPAAAEKEGERHACESSCAIGYSKSHRAFLSPPAGVETHRMTEPNKSVEIPTELPVVPLRQFVVFPYMAIPLFLARDRTIQAVDDALAGDRCVLLTAQVDPELEDPEATGLYRHGTVAMVMR